DCSSNVTWGERNPAIQSRTGSRGFAEAFDPAKAASGGTGQPALARLETLAATRRQPNSQFNALATGYDLKALDFGGALDEAFGQAEANRQIAKIARGSHHHRDRRAVIDQRNGAFLGDHSLIQMPIAVEPRHGDRCWRKRRVNRA